MRTFLAVDISEEVKDKIAGFLDGLRSMDPGVRWVDPFRMHITLLFFGEVDDPTKKNLEYITHEAVSGFSRFRVGVGSIGGFPSLKSPRVVWAGIQNDSGELRNIHYRVRDRIIEERIPVNVEKRDYTPHLTLGRIKKRPSRMMLDLLEEKKAALFGSFEAKSVILYRSTLTRSGPVYDRLSEYQFQ